MGGAGVDTRFHFNASAALAEGIKIGYYHLLRPESSGEAQAAHILSTLNPQDYPVAIDVERVTGVQYPQDYPSKRDYAAVLYNLVMRLWDATGTLPVIYTSAGEWNALINPNSEQENLFAQCRLWVANYGVPEGGKPLLPPVWDTYWLWQYSSTTPVTWTQNKRADMNRFNRPAPPPILPVGFKLYTPFPDYIVPAGGQFNAPRSYPFAPNRLQLHEGMDFVDQSTPQGGIVYCGRGGKVVKVGVDARGYGNYCIVDFGAGWQAWYAHFAEMKVREGRLVETREPLGIAGRTGNSTGVHCHLTLTNELMGLDNYVVRKVVDPSFYLLDWTET